ncbi:MAG: isocitrate lyase/phosphoenolpyruvate mutase family protein [Candidatus Binatia bacterium]
MSRSDLASRFRALHALGRTLVLPNAWDAGSARLIESCGASAIATTSSGVAWACGYPDGDAVPVRVLVDAVARIVRVIDVPLTVDAEGGYASDPNAVAETVRALADAGAVGVNLEDGAGSPDLLCAKIAAVKRVGAQAGVDVFVNTRTDVVLRGLVAPENRVAETLARARRYHEAGCDGIFVPGVSDPTMIRDIVQGIDLPVNVMLVPQLPAIAELTRLGVRRVSAGAAIAQAAHGLARKFATQLLADGGYGAIFEGAAAYGEMNALFRRE